MQRGILLVILAAILWGTAGVSSRLVTDLYPLSPLAIGAWRLLWASPALLLISHFSGANSEKVSRRHFGLFLIYGVTVAVYQLSYFSAVKLTMVSTATLIAICTSPLFVAMLSRIFLYEIPGTRVIMALILSITGTVMIMNIGSAQFSITSNSCWGYCLALCAGFSYATYAVTGKALLTHYSPLRIISITFTMGALFMLPFISFPAGMPLKAWLLLLYLGLVPTALAYIIYTTGLKSTSANQAAIAALLEPLTSTFLSLTLIGERFTLLQSLGAVLLLAALAIMGLKHSGSPKPSNNHNL